MLREAFYPREKIPYSGKICSHFAYISVHLLSFCLHVSFCLQMCIISPTDGYDLEGLSRDKTTQGDLVPLSKDLEGSSGDKTDFD